MKSKNEIIKSYSFKEKVEILERANGNFRVMDQQLIDELEEMDDLLDEEYDMYTERHKNTLKLEYINKGFIPEEFIIEDSVFDLSRKIVHFIFRDGIIEDMHSGRYSHEEPSDIPEGTPLEDISQLSDKNMMALNKYMMDRVGHILHLLQNAEYTKLHNILNQYNYLGSEWNRPEIEKMEKDLEDLILIKNYLNRKGNE